MHYCGLQLLLMESAAPIQQCNGIYMCALGQGVFAKAHFRKGDFVVEYREELINSEESQRRRTYHGQCAVFMFDFYWQERTWW